jgi:DNA-directed RNA polymerase specialized sigma24 family protein
LVAQTGAADPASVRLVVKENRKLSPSEITELVGCYQAGATIRSLGEVFGLHEQTVRAHLRRRGVRLRSLCALTDEQELEVVRLYVEEERSLTELGDRFGVDPSSIRRALIRRGAQRRPSRRR